MQDPRSQRRRVTRSDLSYGVTVYASPDDADPAVVLVHGIGVSHRYFSHLARRLALTHTVISFDMPGFGGMPKPQSDPDVAAMAAALAEVIEEMELAPAVLVGHSMGVQRTVEVGRQRPELVSHVVAIGPVADVEHRTGLAQTRALALDAVREPPWVTAGVVIDYLRCGMRWYLAQLRHMLGYPLEERVASLPVPLLILRGANDPVAGLRWCRHLRARAPHAELVQVPKHRHAVQQSAPRAVASAIAAFAVKPTGT